MCTQKESFCFLVAESDVPNKSGNGDKTSRGGLLVSSYAHLEQIGATWHQVSPQATRTTVLTVVVSPLRGATLLKLRKASLKELVVARGGVTPSLEVVTLYVA